MHCRNCGSPMNDNQIVCLECGVAKGVGDRFCAHCGSAVTPGQVVCLNCGVAIQQPQPYQQSQSYQQPYQQSQPSYQQPQPTQQQPAFELALTALICGILGLMSCGVTSIVAIVCGAIAKKRGNKGGLATAGLVCGIVSVTFWFLYFVFVFVVAFLGAYYSYST